MARTIKEILGDLQEQYMQSNVAETLYGLERGDDGRIATTFDSYFSKAAVERLLLYIVAYAANFLERLMDTAVDDLTALVERQAPGRCDWYARKLLEYQDGDTLNEAGEYDVVDESRRIIKHAVAVDDTATSKLLYLKVAGERGGARCPLSPQQAVRVEGYISQIKYAGVPTLLINDGGDAFYCDATIWYDPVMAADTVQCNCEEAIRAYIENLPFNGEYSNMALEDALQGAKGVKVVGALGTRSQSVNDAEPSDIPDKTRPHAGYFIFSRENITLTMTPYE